MGAPYPPPPVPRHRPIGVTILAVLTILAGIIFLLIGVVIIAICWIPMRMLSEFLESRGRRATGYDRGSMIGYKFGICFGVSLIIAGILSGLWRLAT